MVRPNILNELRTRHPDVVAAAGSVLCPSRKFSEFSIALAGDLDAELVVTNMLPIPEPILHVVEIGPSAQVAILTAAPRRMFELTEGVLTEVSPHMSYLGRYPMELICTLFAANAAQTQGGWLRREQRTLAATKHGRGLRIPKTEFTYLDLVPDYETVAGETYVTGEHGVRYHYTRPHFWPHDPGDPRRRRVKGYWSGDAGLGIVKPVYSG